MSLLTLYNSYHMQPEKISLQVLEILKTYSEVKIYEVEHVKK